ncbi:uncharacterized protein MELLADRAFT_105742 [Melampsora larici-populina 98AG31]|uniref:Thioredoxin domain-containing protein n=1 Tax=Melampsora larici-populina (strain 98AG31 / pathotype 3-4-7) TaxID=747676 RepID=F4RIE0_MELLP|nr:uncharacterized protein MELLADRAFT_105742 [Melampsora larici-populina 98AG31]EGG07685.1 hypothetical protein MELLADRAFT_105742 [Melampsora larici-populina 98AG31]
MLLIPKTKTFDQTQSKELINHLSTTKSNQIIIFYSSHDSNTGQMWCGDCVELQSNLINVFENEKYQALQDQLVYVYVGERDQWRSSDNVFRQSPWSITNLPTILKVLPGEKPLNERISPLDSRLVEDEANNRERLVNYLTTST